MSGLESCWHKWLSLDAILLLATSLVTCYASVSFIETATTVKANSRGDHYRCQRLDKISRQWTAPSEFTVFVLVIGFHESAPPQTFVIVHPDESLNKRPPPSC